MNWKTLFSPIILERARGYVEDARVHDLVKEGDCVSADVAGTKTYRVTVTFTANEVSHMTCTCPYSAQGQPCKHMAAVLYMCEKIGLLKPCEEETSESEDASEDPLPTEEEIEDALADCDPDTMRQFLAGEFRASRTLLNEFLAFCACQNELLSSDGENAEFGRLLAACEEALKQKRFAEAFRFLREAYALLDFRSPEKSGASAEYCALLLAEMAKTGDNATVRAIRQWLAEEENL